MRKKRLSVEQMIGVLKPAELGVPAAEVIRKAGIGEQTFYRWKATCILSASDCTKNAWPELIEPFRLCNQVADSIY